ITTSTTASGGTTGGGTTTAATSAAGTSIPPGAQIVDASKSVWTVNAGVVYRDGVKAGFSANVVQLFWNGSAIYQQNSAGGWWSWDGTTWVDASDPTASTTTTTSAAGSSIPPAAQLVDASGAVWTVNAGVVYR